MLVHRMVKNVKDSKVLAKVKMKDGEEYKGYKIEKTDKGYNVTSPERSFVSLYSNYMGGNSLEQVKADIDRRISKNLDSKVKDAGYVVARIGKYEIIEGSGPDGGSWFASAPGDKKKFNTEKEAREHASLSQDSKTKDELNVMQKERLNSLKRQLQQAKQTGGDKEHEKDLEEEIAELEAESKKTKDVYTKNRNMRFKIKGDKLPVGLKKSKDGGPGSGIKGHTTAQEESEKSHTATSTIEESKEKFKKEFERLDEEFDRQYDKIRENDPHREKKRDALRTLFQEKTSRLDDQRISEQQALKGKSAPSLKTLASKNAARAVLKQAGFISNKEDSMSHDYKILLGGRKINALDPENANDMQNHLKKNKIPFLRKGNFFIFSDNAVKDSKIKVKDTIGNLKSLSDDELMELASKIERKDNSENADQNKMDLRRINEELRSRGFKVKDSKIKVKDSIKSRFNFKKTKDEWMTSAERAEFMEKYNKEMDIAIKNGNSAEIMRLKRLLEKAIQEGKIKDEDNIKSKIIAFFKANPNPDDEKIHAFAEEQGINPHELETNIYALLSEKLTNDSYDNPEWGEASSEMDQLEKQIREAKNKGYTGEANSLQSKLDKLKASANKKYGIGGMRIDSSSASYVISDGPFQTYSTANTEEEALREYKKNIPKGSYKNVKIKPVGVAGSQWKAVKLTYDADDKFFDIRNIEKETIENNNFRKVLFTGNNIQLVLMSLLPNEDIGMEVHKDVDQFFRIDEGNGQLDIQGEGKSAIEDGTSIVIKAGTYHNIIAGDKGLKLYTVYAPPNHPPDRIQKTKAEAVEAKDEGVPSKLEKQGHSEKSAQKIAAYIGRKKYGKEAFQKMAAAGKK